jgi:DNA phosphorothioation-dependent restriction protein DptG
MHVYLYTSTVYSLHIVYLQKPMKTSEQINEHHVKNQWKLEQSMKTSEKWMKTVQKLKEHIEQLKNTIEKWKRTMEQSKKT